MPAASLLHLSCLLPARHDAYPWLTPARDRWRGRQQKPIQLEFMAEGGYSRASVPVYPLSDSSRKEHAASMLHRFFFLPRDQSVLGEKHRGRDSGAGLRSTLPSMNKLQHEVREGRAHLLRLQAQEEEQERRLQETETQARMAQQAQVAPLPTFDALSNLRQGEQPEWYDAPAKQWWHHDLNPYSAAGQLSGDPVDDSRRSAPYLAPIVPGIDGIPARLSPVAVTGKSVAARELGEVQDGGKGRRRGVDAWGDRYVSQAKSLLRWLQSTVSSEIAGGGAGQRAGGDEKDVGGGLQGPDRRESDGARERGGERADEQDTGRAGESTHGVRQDVPSFDGKGEGGGDLGSALVAALRGATATRARGEGGAGGEGSARRGRAGGQPRVWKDMRKLLEDTLRVRCGWLGVGS